MGDSRPFHPYVPERRVEFEVTVREKNFLILMRRHTYGKFTAHKMDNVLIRFESNETIKLDDEELDK